MEHKSTENVTWKKWNQVEKNFVFMAVKHPAGWVEMLRREFISLAFFVKLSRILFVCLQRLPLIKEENFAVNKFFIRRWVLQFLLLKELEMLSDPRLRKFIFGALGSQWIRFHANQCCCYENLFSNGTLVCLKFYQNINIRSDIFSVILLCHSLFYNLLKAQTGISLEKWTWKFGFPLLLHHQLTHE